jgi:hypothetical protein
MRRGSPGLVDVAAKQQGVDARELTPELVEVRAERHHIRLREGRHWLSSRHRQRDQSSNRSGRAQSPTTGRLGPAGPGQALIKAVGAVPAAGRGAIRGDRGRHRVPVCFYYSTNVTNMLELEHVLALSFLRTNKVFELPIPSYRAPCAVLVRL